MENNDYNLYFNDDNNPPQHLPISQPILEDISTNVMSNNSIPNGLLQSILNVVKDNQRQIAEIRADVSRHGLIQKRILEELIAIRKNQAADRNDKSSSVLPLQPLEDLEKLNDFETSLQEDVELFQKVEEEIYHVVVCDPKKYVRLIWQRLLEVAVKFCWKGSENKRAIRVFTLTRAFRSAFNRKFQTQSTDFDAASSRWFRMAKSRIQYRKKTTNQQVEAPNELAK